MHIENRFYSERGSADLFTVIMNESEYRLYSEFQERNFGVFQWMKDTYSDLKNDYNFGVTKQKREKAEAQNRENARRVVEQEKIIQDQKNTIREQGEKYARDTKTLNQSREAVEQEKRKIQEQLKNEASERAKLEGEGFFGGVKRRLSNTWGKEGGWKKNWKGRTGLIAAGAAGAGLIGLGAHKGYQHYQNRKRNSGRPENLQ